MLLRSATPDDAESARTVAEAAYARYLPRMDRRPAPMDADFTAAARAGHLVLVIEGPEVLGYILSYPDGEAWQIDNLAIAPAAQGRGQGAALIAWAERAALAAGCRRLALYTNVAMTEAMAVYARLGFQEIDRRSQAGFDRVFFSRDIVALPD